MLDECEHLKPRMSWRKVFHLKLAKIPNFQKAMPYFQGDNRFEAVPDREREEIFEEYIHQLEKKQKVGEISVKFPMEF